VRTDSFKRSTGGGSTRKSKFSQSHTPHKSCLMLIASHWQSREMPCRQDPLRLHPLLSLRTYFPSFRPYAYIVHILVRDSTTPVYIAEACVLRSHRLCTFHPNCRLPRPYVHKLLCLRDSFDSRTDPQVSSAKGEQGYRTRTCQAGRRKRCRLARSVRAADLSGLFGKARFDGERLDHGPLRSSVPLRVSFLSSGTSAVLQFYVDDLLSFRLKMPHQMGRLPVRAYRVFSLSSLCSEMLISSTSLSLDVLFADTPKRLTHRRTPLHRPFLIHLRSARRPAAPSRITSGSA
jgi:hypothetical protein